MRLFFLIFIATAMGAHAVMADVWINGKRLNRAEINQLAHYTCGPVYPGNYWINMTNGYWGYMGSTRTMGHIKDRCPAGSKGVFKQGNMSREGRLFSPGELLR